MSLLCQSGVGRVTRRGMQSRDNKERERRRKERGGGRTVEAIMQAAFGQARRVKLGLSFRARFAFEMPLPGYAVAAPGVWGGELRRCRGLGDVWASSHGEYATREKQSRRATVGFQRGCCQNETRQRTFNIPEACQSRAGDGIGERLRLFGLVGQSAPLAQCSPLQGLRCPAQGEGGKFSDLMAKSIYC